MINHFKQYTEIFLNYFFLLCAISFISLTLPSSHANFILIFSSQTLFLFSFIYIYICYVLNLQIFFFFIFHVSFYRSPFLMFLSFFLILSLLISNPCSIACLSCCIFRLLSRDIYVYFPNYPFVFSQFFLFYLICLFILLYLE